MLKITQKYYRSVIGFFFIALISLSMLFFGMDLGGPQQDSHAMKINDTEISFSEVYQRRREYQDQLRQAFGPNYMQIAGEHLGEMNQRVVDNLVSEIILLQLAADLGLVAGARKIQSDIQEMFGGNFSLAMYEGFLQQQGFTARQPPGDLLPLNQRQELRAALAPRWGDATVMPQDREHRARRFRQRR